MKELQLNILKKQDILSLSLGLFLTLLPFFIYVPIWHLSIIFIFIALRVAQVYRIIPLIPTYILTVFAITSIVIVLLGFGTIIGLDGGTALLLIMTGLKLLETQKLRDAVFLIFLNYFLFSTLFFYDQSLPIVVYSLLVLIIITASFIRLNQQEASLTFITRLRWAGLFLLHALPLTLILFIFFPRLPGPLWQMPLESKKGLTGLSEQMAPGSIGDLAESSKIAFRVEFQEQPPLSQQLYWRGPILTRYDGKTWYTPRYTYTQVKEVNLAKEITYQVTLEPHGYNWLFALDMPASLPEKSRITLYYQLQNNNPINDLKKYQVSSALNYSIDIDLPNVLLQESLQLPNNNQKTIALARQWQQEIQNPEQIITKALNYYVEQGFTYTLKPPVLGNNPMDEFLFETKQGFCEHYSSSFVILMRAAGIPARVVTGYQGGELNPMGDYFLVRQSDAHAWAEVWLENKGWIRIDPTAVISPERIEQGLGDALEEAPLFAKRDFGWFHRVTLTWDMVNNNWNQWILGYNAESQMHFLQRFGIQNAEQMIWIVGLSIFFIPAFIALIIFFYSYIKQPKDPVVRIYYQLLTKIEKTGLEVKYYKTSTYIISQVIEKHPMLKKELETINQLYIKLRYDVFNKADLQKFKKQVADLKI